jgi:hypothetical protein
MAIRAVALAVKQDALSDLYSWSGLLNGDTGAPAPIFGSQEIIVMIASGTLGAGGNILWQGSFDGLLWFSFSTKIGTPATLNQTALLTPSVTQERAMYIRPNVTAGDGTTTLVAQALCRRTVA